MHTACITRGGVAIVDELAPQWHELCVSARTSEPFHRPEWIGAYLRAFEPASTVLVAARHDLRKLQAVLPFVERETLFCGLPVRMLQGAANTHSCRFDLLRAANGDGEAAVQDLWNVLRDRAEWDVIELPLIPQGGAAESLLAAAKQDGYLTGQWESLCSAYIPLAGITDASSIPRDAHFRQNLRRRLAKAKKRWPVELTHVRTADPNALQRFYEVEKSGWKGKDRTAIDCSDSTRRFYDEIASVAARFGYCSIYLLHFGDRVVAGHFGLSFAGRYYSPKVAYDEEYASYGPGHLIVEAILGDILPQRFEEFDFLGHWMPWKGEWARHGRTHSTCYIFRPGLLGHTLYSLRFRLLKSLRPIVRRVKKQSRAVGPPGQMDSKSASGK
jgi:CelD/BcsL family acetyltransferase involved in cellulose biosynthesis